MSGADAQKFSFLGFLPRKPGRHRKALEEALSREETLVIYESPYRVLNTLRVLHTLAPNHPLIVCRELTKKFEEILRGTADEIAATIAQRKEVKGEFVIVVGTGIARQEEEQHTS